MESSNRALHVMRTVEHGGLFRSRWERVLFVHYETDPGLLQPEVPFELDLVDGRALVSLVAFRMSVFRLRWGGRLGRWLFAPIGAYELLNVRTYVRHGGERGIYFLAEWVPNRLAVALGPPVFGLPYRRAAHEQDHRHETGAIRGVVTVDGAGRLEYDGSLGTPATFGVSAAGTLEAFALEQYTAFTTWWGARRLYRIWHDAWMQAPVDVRIVDDSALRTTGPWFESAELAGAHYSPGADEVWIGRPRRVSGPPTGPRPPSQAP